MNTLETIHKNYQIPIFLHENKKKNQYSYRQNVDRTRPKKTIDFIKNFSRTRKSNDPRQNFESTRCSHYPHN